MDYTENAWLAFEALEKLIIKDFNNYGEADFADRHKEFVLSDRDFWSLLKEFANAGGSPEARRVPPGPPWGVKMLSYDPTGNLSVFGVR